ncbi:dipeptidase [Parvularcula dongshanensis]|uniref:Membrane dipeptidase n=1 Tax=Parvularcula dongshanensis TaxID=1173995 RepID=A0A840I0Y7_9PROT|nr:dipeptidase [Parvularcula dongshanensis]MBB4658397.1 membrane dipeptidase [Parvularcula dongshanensis]
MERAVRLGLLAAVTALGACASPQGAGTRSARAVHDEALVLDSHLDTPAALVRPGFDVTARHEAGRDDSQVDLPRMKEGGLDGGFFVIYTPQGPLTEEGYAEAAATAEERASAIERMVREHPSDFALATTSEGARQAEAEGRRVVLMSIENSYPLGESVFGLEGFHRRGVRMVGPVHFRDNQFAGSATGESGKGLTPLGFELVAEANRLGMIVDASHASDAAFDDMLEASRTPIILSHSGARAIYDHPRNIDDDRLRKLAAAGGLIQVNAYGGYLADLPETPERDAALEALGEGPGATIEDEATRARRRAEIDAAYPRPYASFEDFTAQLLHILAVVGPDHVGIGADWDGGGGVDEMRDVSDLPMITERLLEEGYTPEEIEKIWGGNLLRLLDAAAAAAD